MAIHGRGRGRAAAQRSNSSNPGRTVGDRQRYVQQQQQRRVMDAPAESLGDKLLRAFGFKQTTFAANASYTDDRSVSKDFASLTSTAQRRPQMSDADLMNFLNQVSAKKR